MTHVSPAAPFDPATATIAIVTYNRSGLLTRLLTSITEMDPKPGHVVIVDNASTDDTTELVESFRQHLSRVGSQSSPASDLVSADRTPEAALKVGG